VAAGQTPATRPPRHVPWQMNHRRFRCDINLTRLTPLRLAASHRRVPSNPYSLPGTTAGEGAVRLTSGRHTTCQQELAERPAVIQFATDHY
jgi:hypothetical protein